MGDMFLKDNMPLGIDKLENGSYVVVNRYGKAIGEPHKKKIEAFKYLRHLLFKALS